MLLPSAVAMPSGAHAALGLSWREEHDAIFAACREAKSTVSHQARSLQKFPFCCSRMHVQPSANPAE
jgi:hypothetical protein